MVVVAESGNDDLVDTALDYAHKNKRSGAGGEDEIRRVIPGWSDDGASHRMNYDTPPLKGLRLEPSGSIRNQFEKSIRYALAWFHPQPKVFCKIGGK